MEEYVMILRSKMFMFFFFKQKTAYEMRISDWSSDVCSSDLRLVALVQESLSVATRTGAARPSDFAKLTVDTTVQPKNVMFPTDARQIGRASCRERVCQYV